MTRPRGLSLPKLTLLCEHVPESSAEILGNSVSGITYRHYGYVHNGQVVYLLPFDLDVGPSEVLSLESEKVSGIV